VWSVKRPPARIKDAWEVELDAHVNQVIEKLIAERSSRAAWYGPFSRLDVLNNLAFRVNAMTRQMRGLTHIEVTYPEEIEDACQALVARFDGMTKELALGQLLHNINLLIRRTEHEDQD
jgi:hypothetical protein